MVQVMHIPMSQKKKHSGHCRNFEKGNLVNWDTAEFQLTNMTAREMPIKEICQPVQPGNVLMARRTTFESLVTVCEKFHGKTSVVKSEQMQDQLSQVFFSSDNCKKGEFIQCAVSFHGDVLLCAVTDICARSEHVSVTC